MFSLFGPHTVFHVIGRYKTLGNLILSTRFLEAFEKKEHAEKVARHIQLYGDPDGRTYARVDVESVVVRTKMPELWRKK